MYTAVTSSIWYSQLKIKAETCLLALKLTKADVSFHFIFLKNPQQGITLQNSGIHGSRKILRLCFFKRSWKLSAHPH